MLVLERCNIGNQRRRKRGREAAEAAKSVATKATEVVAAESCDGRGSGGEGNGRSWRRRGRSTWRKRERWRLEDGRGGEGRGDRNLNPT